MRNDISFPCMEQPTRCYLRVSHNGDDDNDEHLLSCTRGGSIVASALKKRRPSACEEWILVVPNGINNSSSNNNNSNHGRIEDQADAGIVQLVNRGHNLVLGCTFQGSLQAVPPKQVLEEEDQEEEDRYSWCMEYTDNGNVRFRSLATNLYVSSCLEVSFRNLKDGTTFVRIDCCSSSQASTKTAVNNNEDNSSDQNIELDWKMDFLTGELCYIQLAPSPSPPTTTTITQTSTATTTKSRKAKPTLLMCDNLGNLRITNNFGGWEVWRFIEAGHHHQHHKGMAYVRISSWTHSHFYLCCNAQGRVSTTQDPFGEDTLWEITHVGCRDINTTMAGDGVVIQSVPHKRYLTYSTNNNGLTAVSIFTGSSSATWHLTAAHRQQYYLSNRAHARVGNKSKQLSLLQKGTKVTLTQHRRDCEVWELQRCDNGTVILRSEKWDKFLAVGHDGVGVVSASSLTAQQQQERTTTPDGKSCQWRVIPHPSGCGVSILNAMPATDLLPLLSCDDQGHVEAVVDPVGQSEACWILQPKMPHSLEQWQINLMVGGVVGAALLGPVVAAGLVGEGIAAGGAAAAAVSSTEAAVAVEAATVGFGLAEAGAALAAGAAVGATATGAIVVVSQRTTIQGTQSITDADDCRQENRPFCDWKNW